jgi:hypothetical protein
VKGLVESVVDVVANVVDLSLSIISPNTEPAFIKKEGKDTAIDLGTDQFKHVKELCQRLVQDSMEIIKDTPVTCDDCLFKYNKGVTVNKKGEIQSGPPAPSDETTNAEVVSTNDSTGVTTVETTSNISHHQHSEHHPSSEQASHGTSSAGTTESHHESVTSTASAEPEAAKTAAHEPAKTI